MTERPCKASRPAHHFIIETPTPGNEHMLGKCKYCGVFRTYRKDPLAGSWQEEGNKRAKNKQGKKASMARN